MNDLNYPNGNCALNIQNVSPMQQYVLKQQIDAEVEIWKDSARTANKLSLADHKYQLDMQRDEKRAELLEMNYKRRQLMTRAVAENSDGYLLMELVSPDGQHSFSEPICSEKYFRGKYYFAPDSVPEENVLKIIWQGEEEGIFLLGNKMNAKAMGKEFLTKGVAFRIPRRAKQEVLAQIFSFLISRAEKIEVTRCVGWSKNSTGFWVFEKDEKNTLEGMNYGR